jgi:hypothetical protein
MVITTLEQLKGLPGTTYLASPYSRYHGGLDEACRLVSVAAAELMKRGHRIFCPIAHSHAISIAGGIDPLDWDFWMKQDQGHILSGNGLIVLKLDGWTESIGVTDEIAAFQWQGKPVLFLEPSEVGL